MNNNFKMNNNEKNYSRKSNFKLTINGVNAHKRWTINCTCGFHSFIFSELFFQMFSVLGM